MLSATPNSQTFVEIRHETTDAKSIAFPLVTEIPVASEEIEVLLGEKVQARVRETFPVRQDTVKGRVAGGIAEEQTCQIIDCKVENDPDRLFGLMKTELEKFQNWQQVLAPRLILGVRHPGFVGPAQTHLPFLPRYAICMSIPTIRKYFFASCQGFSVWFPPLLSAEGAAFRAECKAKGKKLVVWTVNDVKEMKECLRWGDDVEAIITDCPDAVRSLAKKVKRTPAILSSSRFWKMLFPWSSLTYYSFRHLAEAQEWHEYLESQGGAFDGFLPDAEQVEQHQILLSSVEEASK